MCGVLGQIVLCLVMLGTCFTVTVVSQEHHTNEWAVNVAGGMEAAQLVADQHDFHIVNKVFDDVYLFRHKRLARRSAEPYSEHHERLIGHPEVLWAEQQVVKRRVKRDFLARATTNFKSTWLNDPKWPQMWYLNRGGSLDMNVQKAWAEGVSGKGVVVTILDDGLEKDHPDLIKNYDPNASYDVNSHDADPMPRYDLIDSNRHGTRCAGEVAADGNNSICAVGVAYEASVGGVRMLDGDVTDAVEARSLALNPQHIDIYSASWGPDDDGKTVDGPGQLATRAFIEGINRGRNGKGSIFVWASGNGGRDQDNCNCDGYTNSIWTLSISSATEKGRVPWYSEACSSTLATTYSSGSLGERQIVTTDLHHSCTTSHTGTSASAPLAAAICALALQVNREISWRDMQHIVLRTARPENLEAPDWQTNGVGRKVSHRFGYGLMDAYGMVALAKNWTSVPTQRKCEVEAPHVDKLIPQKSFVTLELEVKDCPGVNYLEHVQAKVSLTADRRGEIEIYLTSPAGTKSTLLAQRPHDSSRSGFHSWPFMTVHMWGEKPLGIWQLEIHNNGHFFSTGKAEIKEWSLVLHGTETEPGVPAPSDNGGMSKSSTADISSQSIYPPQHTSDKQASTGARHPSNDGSTPMDVPVTSAAASPTPKPMLVLPTAVPSKKLPLGCKSIDASGACIECEEKDLIFDGKCVSSCPSSYYEHRSETEGVAPRCSACHYSCRSCSGPQDDQCTQCWDDATIYQPNNAQNFCHAKTLLGAYRSQQSWYTFVMVLLLILLALVLILGIMVLRLRKNHGSSSALTPLTSGLTNGTKSTKLSNGRSSYAPISRTDSDMMTKIPFHDLTSDDEI